MVRKPQRCTRGTSFALRAGVSTPTRFVPVLLLVLATSAVSLMASESTGKTVLVNTWEGRTVVVKRTLYSIVFDERSRMAPVLKRQDRVSGLTVATWSETYYRFDARRSSERDIVERDPNRVVSNLREQYLRSRRLDPATSKDVEPLMLARYDPGATLLVRTVHIERDRVRLMLHKDRKSDLATTLTVQWPIPLSDELAESALIDEVLARFVSRSQ